MNNNNPIISVVVPVYNAASTIDMALDSLVKGQFLNMNPEDWEIIVVNDGSMDNSLEKLKKWHQNYPQNIVVITGGNRGVSHARNLGLEKAKGNWIAFVDADDYLLPNSFHTLLSIAKKTGVDVVRFGFTMVKALDIADFPKTEITYLNKDVTVCGGLDFLNDTRGMIESRSQWNACFGIYSRDSLKDIFFPEDIIVGEDCLFTWDVMLRNPRVALVDKDLYIYIQYPTSAMNSTDSMHLERMMQGRHLFCNALLDIRNNNDNILGSRAIDGIETVARNAHNEALINEIMLHRSLIDIWKSIRRYKNLGMKVKPGKPRFYNRNIKYSFSDKLRRWIVAYPIPLAMAIVDFVRCNGFWRIKKYSTLGHMEDIH